VVGATGGKIGLSGTTPVTQPAGADQAAVTLGNVDGEIAGLTISDPPTQAEVQALGDKCEHRRRNHGPPVARGDRRRRHRADAEKGKLDAGGGGGVRNASTQPRRPMSPVA
jgi:hypothetical protein